MQNGQDKLKISKGIARKTQWVLTEKQLKSSGKFSRIYNIDYIQGDPDGLGGGRTWSLRTSKTGSSLCLCSMTSSGKKKDDNCISNAEKSQKLHKEVSTRTLVDFSGSRFGKEMVRQLM